MNKHKGKKDTVAFMLELTPLEKARLSDRAWAARLTMSAYLRTQAGLTEEEEGEELDGR